MNSLTQAINDITLASSNIKITPSRDCCGYDKCERPMCEECEDSCIGSATCTRCETDYCTECEIGGDDGTPEQEWVCNDCLEEIGYWWNKPNPKAESTDEDTDEDDDQSDEDSDDEDEDEDEDDKTQVNTPCTKCGFPENAFHTANGCLPAANGVEPIQFMTQYIKDFLAAKGAVCEFECETCKKQFKTDQYFSPGDDDIPKECLECFEDEDVCCVGCGERVCGFTEEPPHKDERDEAVCDDCWELIDDSAERLVTELDKLIDDSAKRLGM